MDAKAIGRGSIIGVVAYVLIGFIGFVFGVPIFPDPNSGVLAFGRLVFAVAFIVTIALVTAIAPAFLKIVPFIVMLFSLGTVGMPVSAIADDMVMAVPEFPAAIVLASAASLFLLRGRRK